MWPRLSYVCHIRSTAAVLCLPYSLDSGCLYCAIFARQQLAYVRYICSTATVLCVPYSLDSGCLMCAVFARQRLVLFVPYSLDSGYPEGSGGIRWRICARLRRDGRRAPLSCTLRRASRPSALVTPESQPLSGGVHRGVRQCADAIFNPSTGKTT